MGALRVVRAVRARGLHRFQHGLVGVSRLLLLRAGLAVLDVVMCAAAGGDVVSLVVAGGGGFTAQVQATLHCLEEFADGGAVGGDLDLDALVAVEVDDGEGLAGFVEDVLRYVLGALEAITAEGAASAVDVVRMGAGGAVRAVSGKGLHHVELVVVGEAGVSGRDGGEAHLADGGRHDDGFGLRSLNWRRWACW